MPVTNAMGMNASTTVMVARIVGMPISFTAMIAPCNLECCCSL